MRSDPFSVPTFDDGPLAGTDDCIAAMNDKGVKGSFLWVSSHMISDWRNQQVKNAHSSGHLMGNHSHSHWHGASNYDDKTNAEWLADFQQCDAAIGTIIGAGGQFIHSRLPGKDAWRLAGISKDDGNSARVANHLNANGYHIFGWDVEWQYSGSPAASDPVQTPAAMVAAVEARLQDPQLTMRPGKVIVLMHDHQFRSTRQNKQKLLDFIQGLKDSNLPIVFRRLDTYLTD